MLLSDSEIDGIRDKEFSIDGLVLTLSVGERARPKYAGPGRVWQDAKGQLRYVIYDTSTTIPVNEAFSIPTLGSLSDARYRLHVRDSKGREWEAPARSPEPDTHLGKPGVICRGSVYHISYSADFSCSSPSVWLFFPGQFKIAANVATKIRTVAGKQKKLRFERNVWEFEKSGISYHLRAESDGLIVTADSLGDSLPYAFDTRLEEAVSFILARPCEYKLIQECEDDRYKATIWEWEVNETHSRLQPPLRPDSTESPDHLSEMFDRYLQYVCQLEEERYHPTSVNLRQAFRASAVSIETEALLLGVGVESIAEREFKRFGKPAPQFIERVDRALTHLRKLDYNAQFMNRVCSVVGGLKGASGRGALYGLKREGLLNEELIQAWENLRHPAAHGKELEGSIRETLRDCDITYLLLLFLVFLAIGYTGKFTDYSATGWPSRDFTKSL